MDFDKIITGIRKALYGREVREYIASAIEWVKSAITDALEKMKELLKQAEAARDAAKASADKSAASATESANSAMESKRSADASAKLATASANSANESAGYASDSANSANESAGYASDSAASAAASEASAKNSANAAMKALQEAADSGAFKGDKGDTGPQGPSGTTNASEINAGILDISYGGTGASTLDQACGNLLWRDSIPENCNWDTLATGIWRTLPEHWGTNGPTSVYTYGTVFVWNYAGNVTQIYISHSSTDPICFRQRWNSYNNFAQWQTTSTLFATKASGVTDYNDSSRTIQVGWAGDGLNTSNLTQIAGYTDNGTKIKDVSKDVLKSWLGLDSAASGSNYIRFGDGTQICWGTITGVTVTVTGTVEYEIYLATHQETISRNFSAARITFPQAFSNTSYSVAFQNSYNVTDANTYIGSTFDFYSNKFEVPITGGKLVSISSTNPEMGKATTGCTLNSGDGSMYVAVGRWK